MSRFNTLYLGELADVFDLLENDSRVLGSGEVRAVLVNVVRRLQVLEDSERKRRTGSRLPLARGWSPEQVLKISEMIKEIDRLNEPPGPEKDQVVERPYTEVGPISEDEEEHDTRCRYCRTGEGSSCDCV